MNTLATHAGAQPGEPITAEPDGTSSLDGLIGAVREAVARDGDWERTAAFVAEALRAHLPAPDELLTAEQLAGAPGTSSGHRLHVEPDGSFSMVAIVWQPGAVTRVHDHVAWCVFGVLAGVEYEDVYALAEDGATLTLVGHNANRTGEVSGFAPPGDIHRVRNSGDGTAVSLHIYGTDLSRVGSSVRRFYDLPTGAAL
ncbi:cysteine dioxygenase family protein [Actinomadura rupiterrae]|uniref:cysteine dioxygenase family protein n=1 Tax=Actinomadura rupiterrae TaxID=559627 RepID=UPI0020A4BE2A|nr:cysteine dioxygenase family protein [Actinomadura rupiterrae]MCP2342075.1 putative metal-dependent enzyme (double-stranded beta helix superfamily) [Actinomadura rupiterrae]